MLNDSDIEVIRSDIDDYWKDSLESHNNFYYDMAAGKEGGHQLSDKVDQVSTARLVSQFPEETGFQHKGEERSTRSMGDIWFKNDAGEWNPINVKTGLVGSEGQPNIVSLKRVMSAIIEHKIDSYYLLLVKFSVDRTRKTITHNVHLVDILDWLDIPSGESVVTFNSGPGQTMLKAKRFFSLLESGFCPPKLSIRRKMELLMDIYMEGERALIRDRERDRQKFESYYNDFKKKSDLFKIDKNRQKELEIHL